MKTFVNSGIKSRRKQYNRKYLEHMLEVITPDGKSPGLAAPIGCREIAWHCFPLLEAGGPYAKRANSILRNMQFKSCHFMPMNFTQMLKRYSGLIEPDVEEKLKAYIIEHLPLAAADRIHISMYNDNFAGMAIYTLLVAGELFSMPEYFGKGLEKLCEVRNLFMRCGTLMEYGSNTYTPVDTLCYAEIANHIENEEAREIALKCEERMWVEIATHYHPETSRLAGPYSRSYCIDSIGHPHLFSGLAWYVFGDDVFANPMLDLFDPPDEQYMHGGLENLTLPNIAWIVNAEYHCPEYLFNHAFNKSYPYVAEYITECIPSNVYREVPEDLLHEYPGVRGRNYTYMTEEFAMGTSEVQFNGGSMTDSFHITYRNRENAKRLFDTGVIYTKYIFNDRLPGQDNEYSIFGKVGYMGFRDEGRKYCIQDKGTAMVSYKPKQYEKENVSSAKLSIMIPVHFFDDFDIYAGDERVESLPFSSKNSCIIYMKVCNSYFAFIPMDVTDLGRKNFMRIERAAGHIMISFFNYEGETRSFT
ncbi:MAG: hypothetical protein R3232_10920, partial [Clostridia bacterium]|nr:hypothetical protein [Clostridia bacterium]